MLLLLLLLLSNISTVFTMSDAEKFPFHLLVQRVSREGLSKKEAKCEMEKYFESPSYFQDENAISPNNLCKGKTAASLSAFYCVQDAYFYKDQLSILKFLLSKDSEEERSANIKSIADDMDQVREKLKDKIKELEKISFPVSNFYGSGAVIKSELELQAEENTRSRIEKVEKILSNFSLNEG